MSEEGIDDISCVNASSTGPCRTISYAVSQGVHTIHLTETYSAQPQNLMVDSLYLPQNKAISIVIYGHGNSIVDVTMNIESERPGHGKVLLDNVTLSNSSVIIKNIALFFKDCTLNDVSLEAKASARIPNHLVALPVILYP